MHETYCMTVSTVGFVQLAAAQGHSTTQSIRCASFLRTSRDFDFTAVQVHLDVLISVGGALPPPPPAGE